MVQKPGLPPPKKTAPLREPKRGHLVRSFFTQKSPLHTSSRGQPGLQFLEASEADRLPLPAFWASWVREPAMAAATAVAVCPAQRKPCRGGQAQPLFGPLWCKRWRASKHLPGLPLLLLLKDPANLATADCVRQRPVVACQLPGLLSLRSQRCTSPTEANAAALPNAPDAFRCPEPALQPFPLAPEFS